MLETTQVTKSPSDGDYGAPHVSGFRRQLKQSPAITSKHPEQPTSLLSLSSARGGSPWLSEPFSLENPHPGQRSETGEREHPLKKRTRPPGISVRLFKKKKSRPGRFSAAQPRIPCLLRGTTVHYRILHSKSLVLCNKSQRPSMEEPVGGLAQKAKSRVSSRKAGSWHAIDRTGWGMAFVDTMQIRPMAASGARIAAPAWGRRLANGGIWAQERSRLPQRSEIANAGSGLRSTSPAELAVWALMGRQFKLK